MYYVKNVSLVFMLIGLSYCQTGKEQEEELTSQVLPEDEAADVGVAAPGGGAGAAAEPTVRLQSSDGINFVVPLRIARKSQIIANMLDDIAGVDAPIPLPGVTQEGLTFILPLLEHEEITQARLGAVLGDVVQVPADRTRALQLLKDSDYLDIEDLLQQTAIYLGNSFTVAEINSWHEIPPGLKAFIIRLKIGVKVSAGAFHTCAIKMDGTIQQCWGSNNHGQSDVPADLVHVKAVSAGWEHTCAIKMNDTVQCWGRNNHGQRDLPPNLGNVKAVSAGAAHTCAIKMDNNTVHCWGRNNLGQSNVPPNLGYVKAVSAGWEHSCAIMMNDEVRCWGRNIEGQSNVPQGLGYVKAVSAGSQHTCAIRRNDIVQCWGSNNDGQINVPQGLGYVKAVSAGWEHTCAVKRNNTAHCWGDNLNGQSDVPDDLGNVKAVSAGDLHTCAIKMDDTVQCWGLNNDGQTTIPANLRP